ncbi:MAG TPA: GAF domain-containing protein [Chloroflexota bacterium]|nr:GAF domain-containing protein [Chloroflexota bacterium]
MAVVPRERQLSPEGLRDLLAIVNSSRGLDEILSYLVVQAQQVLAADAAALYLRNPSNPDVLEVKAAHGIPADLVNDTVYVGNPVIGLSVSLNRIVSSQDFRTALRQPFATSIDEQIQERGPFLDVVRAGPVSRHDEDLQRRNRRFAELYATITSIPLTARDETYGALVLYHSTLHPVDERQVDLGLAFAQQAALAIENARLRAQADQRLTEIVRRQQVAEGLRDLLVVVNSNHDLDEILDEVLAQSNRLLGNESGAVYLRTTEDESILRLRAAHGLEQGELALELRVGSPTTGLAVAQSRTLVCYDLVEALDDNLKAADTRLIEHGDYAQVERLGAQTDPDLEPTRVPRVRQLVNRFRGVIATPLVARGRTFGALTLFYNQPRVFSDEEVALAGTFAQQAQLAIENARLHVEAEQRMRENERRRRVAEGMRDLLAVVNSSRSLDEMLDAVLEQSADMLGSDAGSVLLVDPRAGEQKALTVRASRALISDILPQRLPVGYGVTGVAVERGQTVVVPDLMAVLSDISEPWPLVDQRTGYLELRRVGHPSSERLPRISELARYYRAVLSVPLKIRGRVEGALTLYYSRTRQFSREDVRLAEAFADQTGLAIENARLHSQSLQHSRDLEALYRADEVLYRSLRLEEVLQALVDVATDVLRADMTSVLVWDEHHEKLVPGATRGFRPEVVAQMSHRPGEGVTTIVATSGQPVAVEDALTDPRVAHRITDVEGIRSLLHVPIKVNGEVFGVFGVNYRQPRTLVGDEEKVLLALAHRAAVAIENARLFTESQQRFHELEALYRADETLHGSLRLDDVLEALADVAVDVLQADKTSVHVWDRDRQQLVTAASRGYSHETVVQTLEPGTDLMIGDAHNAELLIVHDPQADPRLSPRLRAIIEHEQIEAAIAAPITVGGQVFGLFGVAWTRRHTLTHEQRRLVLALAQRAGLAIQNARLFEQAQQAATAEERQRLARELHDAVTQTLFSASLIAEVVPKLWERNPDEGRRRLEELRRLTRGALAEMRTLLLELRPAALVETPFSHLLRQLGEAAASRSNLAVECHIDGAEWSLPAEVQIALYRIAQEALNNTGKHAGALHAQLHLRWTPDTLNLRVQDDGRGFDPKSTPPGHLGVGIMHERARAIGARLRIESRPGAGTRVATRWRRLA